jgi:hypothetical protein
VQDLSSTNCLDLRSVDELVGPVQSYALGQRQLCAADRTVEVEDGDAITVLYVLDCALPIAASKELSKWISEG